ncbi:unnamed protein product [Closterium sp. Yama58-4]|nr:unnamed protein product [Closterium sp. Yama58-4]
MASTYILCAQQPLMFSSNALKVLQRGFRFPTDITTQNAQRFLTSSTPGSEVFQDSSRWESFNGHLHSRCSTITDVQFSRI